MLTAAQPARESGGDIAVRRPYGLRQKAPYRLESGEYFYHTTIRKEFYEINMPKLPGKTQNIHSAPGTTSHERRGVPGMRSAYGTRRQRKAAGARSAGNRNLQLPALGLATTFTAWIGCWCGDLAGCRQVNRRTQVVTHKTAESSE